MKRLLSLLLVGFIVCLIILNPLWVGSHSKVRAYTLYESLLMMYPAQFWSWYTAQTASMGMQVTEFRDQLTHLNKNGQISQYFSDVYSRYQSDVEKTVTVAGIYYKTVASFWEDLFNGGNGITGIKEMWTGSTNAASPWYINPNSQTISFHLLPILTYNGTNIYTYLNGLSNEVLHNLVVNSGFQTIELGNYAYSVTNVFGNLSWISRNMTTNGISTISTFNIGSLQYNTHGYVFYRYWINSGGVPDINGNVYKLGMANILSFVNGSNIGLFNGLITPIDSLYNTDLETASVVEFDETMLSNVLLPADITDKDYVGTLVPTDFATEMQMMLEHVIDGTQTLEQAVIALPQVADLKIETTVPAIRQITGAVAVAEVDTPSYPQVERFKMPTGLSTKFPFSIPWDLRNAVLMMQASPVIPIFTIPFVIPSINFSDEIVLDLTQFDYLARITRWFILALFMIGLILVTRKLIKG